MLVSREEAAMSRPDDANNLSYLKAMAEAGRRTRVVPALLSADLARSQAFYSRLGFKTEYPDYASQRPRRLGFERDGIYLFFYDEPIGAHKSPVMSGTIYVFPESVDALAAEWRDKVSFIWGPELMPYGLYEFGIADPDGYHLAFAERRAPSPTQQ
jgi:catechol 2,3-dioxygenase-like lactoylglutathione lyase family enzyme